MLGQHATSVGLASDDSSGSPHRPLGVAQTPAPPSPSEAAANTTSTTATTVEDGDVATTASSAASQALEHELERLRQSGTFGGAAAATAKSVEADSSGEEETSDEDGADEDEAGDDRPDDDETVNDDGTDADADADAVKAPQPKVIIGTIFEVPSSSITIIHLILLVAQHFHGAARLKFGQNPDPAAIGTPPTTSTTTSSTTTVGPATSAEPTVETVAVDTTSAALASAGRKDKRRSFAKLIQSYSSPTKTKVRSNDWMQ